MEHEFKRVEDKLDQILAILHGDGKQEMGMVQKVNILWLLVLKWPLYVVSIILGAGLTVIIQKFFK